jgi:hypothetical protein
MLSRELEDVVMRTLAKDPKDRPASAEVFAGELLAALEAHAAQTSGVRASITNAAGIRVPESMRPPPMALPKLKKRFPVLVLAVPLVLVAAAAGVYLGMSRRAQPVAPPAVTVEPVTAGTASPPATATEEPPTVTPDSLPRAAPTTTTVASASGGKHGKPPPPPKPTGKTTAARPPPGTAPPAASAAPGYGIFD